MATNINLVSDSPLIGSPIVYEVTANAVSSTTFHRIKLTVNATLQDGSSSFSSSYILSSPANSSEVVRFDISSALRAIADRYEYTPTPPASYPVISYILSAVDEYMQNGEVIESGVQSYGVRKALFGGYSDLERLKSNGRKKAHHFTRKPKTLPEVVMVGETMVCPKSFSSSFDSNNIPSGPTSEVVSINTSGLQTINGRSVFALPAGQPDRYQFRFVNGLGCMESVSLSTLRSVDMNCTVEEYIRSVQETFGSFSRAATTKKNDFETWKMSTPPLDEAWHSWFMHEFMMATLVWINIDGIWVSCHILPEETIAGVNRAGGDLISTTFSVRLDINGSPLSSLAV